jgi:hypothetical protein
MQPLSQALLSVVLLCTLSACSSQQVYGAGQAWQRNECLKLSDEQARSRCLSGATAPYEQYKRDAEAASRPK